MRAGSHVDAHLVRATGVDAHPDESRSVQNLGYVVHRERCATAELAHVHALAVARTNLLRGLHDYAVARAGLRWTAGMTPWE